MSLWVSPSGKVHLRRERWYAGTSDERAVPPDMVIMLCGKRKNLVPAPEGAEVTCGTCSMARSKDQPKD